MLIILLLLEVVINSSRNFEYPCAQHLLKLHALSFVYIHADLVLTYVCTCIRDMRAQQGRGAFVLCPALYVKPILSRDRLKEHVFFTLLAALLYHTSACARDESKKRYHVLLV